MANIESGFHLVPEHMQDAVRRYVNEGLEPGSFLTLMLEHRIYDAAGHADSINQSKLFDWIRFMHNYMPGHSHGSPEVVKAYMSGRRKAAEHQQTRQA